MDSSSRAHEQRFRHNKACEITLLYVRDRLLSMWMWQSKMCLYKRSGRGGARRFCDFRSEWNPSHHIDRKVSDKPRWRFASVCSCFIPHLNGCNQGWCRTVQFRNFQIRVNSVGLWRLLYKVIDIQILFSASSNFTHGVRIKCYHYSSLKSFGASRWWFSEVGVLYSLWRLGKFPIRSVQYNLTASPHWLKHSDEVN